MARKKKTDESGSKSQATVQSYPRITDKSSKEEGFLDTSVLATHKEQVDKETLRALIINAIHDANKKSGRRMLNLPEDADSKALDAFYVKNAKALFDYFRKYGTDPASTALQLAGQHCLDVAAEQFKIRALQKARMNSGWRYQYLAMDCARRTGRFNSVSDLGLVAADFNAVIDIVGDSAGQRLNIFVSVKNRANTIGGPDWPGAITDLERVASTDKNLRGPYICVFGFVMERGNRNVKRKQDGQLRSPNTELWASDFFWPFFTNSSYEDIMQAVLEVLTDNPVYEEISIEVPVEILEIFEDYCRTYELIDEDGRFSDPKKLVTFFCTKYSRKLKRRKPVSAGVPATIPMSLPATDD